MRDAHRPQAETTLPADGNHLIARLSRRGREHLLTVCEPVQLQAGVLLCKAGEQVRHVYFPDNCFISLLTSIEGGPGIEVGMVGREGMLGAQLALGLTNAPLHGLVQGSGTARRVAVLPFRRELALNPALHGILDRYLYVLMAQLSLSGACTRFHRLGPRLARWLLMNHDRAHSDTFHLTQEFLASMLGVRRVGVTRAAGDLQRRGLILYHRGEITVLDRSGLEAAACGCYAADQGVYDRVFG